MPACLPAWQAAAGLAAGLPLAVRCAPSLASESRPSCECREPSPCVAPWLAAALLPAAAAAGWLLPATSGWLAAGAGGPPCLLAACLPQGMQPGWPGLAGRANGKTVFSFWFFFFFIWPAWLARGAAAAWDAWSLATKESKSNSKNCSNIVITITPLPGVRTIPGGGPPGG